MSYLRNIFTTGATGKTPDRILKVLASEAAGAPDRLIVELGAGQGEITEHLLRQEPNRGDRFIAYEINTQFATRLRERFPGIVVKEDSALVFSDTLEQDAELIISSLPLSFFKAAELQQLLQNIHDRIRPGGKAIILFHAFWLIPKLKKIFRGGRIRSFAHIPPYYILSYNRSTR